MIKRNFSFIIFAFGWSYVKRYIWFQDCSQLTISNAGIIFHFPKYFPPLQFINLNFTLNYKADVCAHSLSKMVLFHHTLTFFPLNVTYQLEFTHKEYIKWISMFCNSVRSIKCHCFTSGGRSFSPSAEHRGCCSCRLPAESKRGPDPNPQAALLVPWKHTQLKEKGKVAPYAL